MEKETINHITEKTNSLTKFAPIRGKGDFQIQYPAMIMKLATQPIEHVYLLTYFIDGTFKFEKLADGEDNSVGFDFSQLRYSQGIARYVVYHNHPPSQNLNPPSSSDFEIAINQSNKLTHRVITTFGIWEIRITDTNLAKKLSNKVGSLFSYLEFAKTSADIISRKKSLDLLNKNYSAVAESYSYITKNGPSEISNRYIQLFESSMIHLGFYVKFSPFPVNQKDPNRGTLL